MDYEEGKCEVDKPDYDDVGHDWVTLERRQMKDGKDS
jgi:hypothetical protein